jgi:hypothetical protein
MYDSTRKPDVKTVAKRKVVTPPRTGFGMARKTPEILPIIPNKIKLPCTVNM